MVMRVKSREDNGVSVDESKGYCWGSKRLARQLML